MTVSTCRLGHSPWLIVSLAILALLIFLAQPTQSLNIDRNVKSVNTQQSGNDQYFPYVIVPKNGKDGDQEKHIDELLKPLVKEGTLYKSRYEECLKQVFYWSADLKETDAQTIKNDGAVAEVIKQCTKDCPDPWTAALEQAASITAAEPPTMIKRESNPSLVRATPAGNAVVLFAQDEDVGNIDYFRKNYIYDKRAGSGTTVYIVDTGANLKHDEFKKGKNIASKARWLHANPVYSTDEDESSLQGHGTCMLSKVTGHDTGIAKDINPVIVRVPYHKATNSFFIWEFFDGVAASVADFCAKKRNGELEYAVMELAFYIKPTDQGVGDSTIYGDALARVLKEGVNNGLLPVTGTGNDGATRIDGFPATFGKLHPDHFTWHIPELILVGAVDDRGMEKWPKSNTDDDADLKANMIYAPGFNEVRCADSQIPDYLRTATGTSPASAAVAGLAAYFLSLQGRSPADLARYLRGLAWNRNNRNKELRTAWNNINRDGYNNDPISPPDRSPPDRSQPNHVYCVPYQNPGVTSHCTCDGKEKASFTASGKCPQTSPVPTELLITSAAPAPTTQGVSFPFTTTYPNGAVVECTAFSTMNVGIGPISICQGNTISTANAPAPTGSMQVVAHHYIDQISDKASWAFFDGGADPCKGKAASEVDAKGGFDIEKPGFPDGKFTIDIQGMKGCAYEGKKDHPGTFSCSGLGAPAQCKESDDRNVVQCDNPPIDTKSEIRKVVLCAW